MIDWINGLSGDAWPVYVAWAAFLIGFGIYTSWKDGR